MFEIYLRSTDIIHEEFIKYISASCTVLLVQQRVKRSLGHLKVLHNRKIFYITIDIVIRPAFSNKAKDTLIS